MLVTCRSMPGTPSSSARLTRLDAALAVLAVVVLLATALLPPVVQRPFAKMFTDFGARLELPLATRMALSPWVGVGITSPALVILTAGLLARRRVVLLVALGAALLGVAVGIPAFLGAMYLPIFQLADKVSAAPGPR
jgi:hypothetical protein